MSNCSPAIVFTAPPCCPKNKKTLRSLLKKISKREMHTCNMHYLAYRKLEDVELISRSRSRRYSKKFNCPEDNNCNGSGNGGNKINPDCGGNGDKKRNFMEDVWKVMTPDMLNKLVNILVDEFHLTKAEACKFVNQQREGAKMAEKKAQGKCPCAPNMVPAIPNMEVRNLMIKEFMEVAACKLSDYMALVLTARIGTRRQEILADNINKSVDEFLGITEDTHLGKVIRVFSGKLSLWVDNKLDDSYDCGDKRSKK